MGRAIVRSPKAFLMDEPLSNLDAKLRVQMRTQVSRLQKQLGTTTVYVTHDQTEAMTLGDRVVVMRGGYIQQVGDPQTLYDHPANLFVAGFIGSPSMNFLPATRRGRRAAHAARRPAAGRPVRRALEAGDAPRELILGIRPEHFEDAALVEDAPAGARFRVHRAGRPGRVDGLRQVRLLHRRGRRGHARPTWRTWPPTPAAPTCPAARPAWSPGCRPSPGCADGADAKVWLNLDKIHLFDPGDGRNITLEAA